MANKFNIKTFDTGVEINGRGYEKGRVTYDVKGNSIKLLDQREKKYVLDGYTSYKDVLINGQVAASVDALVTVLRAVFFSPPCGSGGGGTTGPTIGIATILELEDLDSSKHVAYYAPDSRTIYQFFEEDPGDNTGSVPGLAGVWVPWAYRTVTGYGQSGLSGDYVGNADTPSNDGFVNRAMFRVIAPPGQNMPVFASVSDGPRAAGYLLVNIDFNNGSIMPEGWYRATVEDGEAAVCAAITNRLLVSASHPRQMGVGHAMFKISNPEDFWQGNDIPADDDAVLSWYSKDARLNQMNSFASMQALTSHYLTGHGHAWFKSALQTGTHRFTGDLVVSHQAATYMYEGAGGNVTLPNPTAIDRWGKLEYENMIKTFINVGTGVIIFDREIMLDGGDTVDRLNYVSPNNVITIKCVAGNWYKV